MIYKYNIKIVILRTNKIIYICDDYITIYLLFAHFIKSNNNYIYQLKSIDIVIIISDILNR